MDWGVILGITGLAVMFAGTLWLLRSEDKDVWLDDPDNHIRGLVVSGYRAEHERGLHLAAKVDGCPMCEERE